MKPKPHRKINVSLATRGYENVLSRSSPSRRSSSSSTPSTRDSTLLGELRALYTKIDAAFDGWGCEASTDCCRFGVTGREPYPTAIELAELERSLAARGGRLPKRRLLPVASERRCTLLSDEGKCLIYASRPFGCRTFFCERGHGPVGESALPHAEIKEIARDIANLSAKFAPADPGPRPLSNAMRAWEARRSR